MPIHTAITIKELLEISTLYMKNTFTCNNCLFENIDLIFINYSSNLVSFQLLLDCSGKSIFFACFISVDIRMKIHVRQINRKNDY